MPTVGPNYVGVSPSGSSAIAGTWTNITNSDGNTPGTAATWVNAARSTTATWQGTNFGFTSASVPSGGVLNSISISVLHGEGASSASFASVTGQLYYSGVAVGSAQTFTLTTTSATQTWVVTDLGLYSNLANYQVRVVGTRGNNTTSTTLSIFDCSITLTYTATGTDTYSTIVANDQPMAYWRLADVGTTAADATGNGHTGTLSATGVTTGVTGVIGGNAAMSFTAASSGQISSASFPSWGTQHTFECWFNVPAPPAVNFVITVPNAAYKLYFDSAGLLVWTDGTRSLWVPATNYCDGNWHHYVVTFDGTTAIEYIDGASVSSSVAAWAAGAVSTLRLASDASVFLTGTLDEVAVYSYGLTSTRVAAHYAAGAPAAAQIWQPPAIRKLQAVQRASTW